MERIKYNETVFTVPYKNGTVTLVRNGTSLTAQLSYQGAYGMGEKYNCLNQKGHKVINAVEEKFCFQGDKTYCATPFFWTDSGFGLYVDTCEVTSFDFREDSIVISLPEKADVIVFHGSPMEMIREYMSLFGKAQLPPEWVFGVWISANRWNCQRDAEAQIEKLKQYDFPASVIVLEAWSDEATFYIWNGAKYALRENNAPLSYGDFDFSDSPWPDPKGLVEKLHAAGLHLLLWQVPVYKKQGSDEIPNAQNDRDRAEAVSEKLCVLKEDLTPYTIPEGHWFSGSMVPDFTNEKTCRSWFAKRQYLLDMGVDGFKTDGGEFIYQDAARFSDGTTGLQGCNRYARDYTEAYYQFAGEQHVIFSRAGFSGQHTVPCLWAGDQQSVNSELSSVLHAGLSAALSGILFWGFDIAGFAGQPPTIDLYRRATQMACFCPIMQWHSEPDGGQFRELMPGFDGNNERSPWNIAELYDAPELLDEMRFWHKLREQLRPYLWKTAQQCVRNSMPMMRPLVYLWPNDALALACEDEYLLGDSLLIAPLLEENAESRTVYLPKGNWIGFFDKKRYQGEQQYSVDAEKTLPVFILEDTGFESFEIEGVPCK